MRSSYSFSCSIHLVSLFAATGFLAAQSRDVETVFELDPLEVLEEQEPGDLTMSDTQINRLQATDLVELFSNQSTIAVGGGASVAQKIYVRGFEDTMLNVTVDGAQQIGELYHHQGRVQLEPDFIKRIELDAGAGAATNGAGALTGAMRVTLKDAFDMLGADQRVGFYLKGTGASSGDGSYKITGSSYAKVTDEIGIIAMLSFARGEDYESGDGHLATPTGYNHDRAYVKLNGAQGPQNWSLSYERLHDFGTYYERPNMIGFRDSFELSDHEMDRDTVTLNHRYDTDNDRVDVNSTLYWTESSFSNHRNSSGTLYGKGTFESLGFDIRNNMVFARHGLTFGTDYRHDGLDSTQQATPPPFWGSSEQSAQVFGLYAQDEWSVLDDIILSGGLRFDAYSHEVDSGVGADVSNDDEGFSPNLSASWKIVDDLTLRAAYARAFRGITIREAFFSALYTHDGTLESEVADNYELGFSWERNGYFFRGTAYHQKISNYINAEYVGGAVWGYWRNMGDAEVDGYEFELGKHWSNAFLSVGVWDADSTFNDQALTDADLGLGTSIGRTWTARVQYLWEDLDLDFALFARYVEDEINEIAPGAPEKESYKTIDFFLTWRPRGDDSIVISAAIRNLFDEFYYDHATYSYNAGAGRYIGFPAKGREPSISVALKF